MITLFALLPIILKEPAYLDPGTGSYIIQLVIGALMGGLFLAGVYWKKLVRFLTGKKEPPPVEEEFPAPEETSTGDETPKK